MKPIKLVSFIFFALLFASCEKLAMEPDPKANQLAVFDEYAKLSIEKFGLSAVKEVDLEALRDSIRPFINNGLSDQQLFDYMSIITLRMREGHTSLGSLDDELYAAYFHFPGYPPAKNFIIVENNYFGEAANPDVQIISPTGSFFEWKYGFLSQDDEIGYIEIPTFDLEISDSEINQMMDYLKDAKGIIIDVRGNLGGFISLAARLASHFTAQEVIFGTDFIKNGPGRNDFAPSELKLSPAASGPIYTNKVVILQDRITFSSGALLVTMMSAMENKITVGQIYGGGTGTIIDGFLSNGWKYNLSSSNLIDSQGHPTDNGIEADIPMIIDPADTITDALIERAILELQ